MFGVGGSGSYSRSDTKGKSKSKYWTGQQMLTEQNLGKYFAGYDVTKGLPKYEGQLAGTYTPETMSNIFKGAEAYSRGESSPLFSHFQQYNNPAQREAQIASRLEARRRLLAPQQQVEDAALKAKMSAMGLGYSADMLKKQADIQEVRRAEEDLIASDLLDRYEALGYQAGNEALAAIQGIGQAQYQIRNAGLEAEFNEWLRTQPEFNPMLEKMMAYLGLQGVSETKSKEGTTAWGASGGANYGA